MRRRTLLVGIGLVIATVAIISVASSFFSNAELKILDIRMYSKAPTPPLGVVAIAAIDDHSIEELGRWPWPRRVLAKIVDSLHRYNARIVCLDLLFSDPDNSENASFAPGTRPSPSSAATPNDRVLADAIRSYGNVFVGIPFKFEGQREEMHGLTGFSDKPFTVTPNAYAMVRLNPQDNLRVAKAYLPLLDVIARSARGIGFVNIEADRDSIVRSEPMAISFGDRYYIPLGLAAVAAYYGNSALLLRPGADGRLRVLVGDKEIPLDEYGEMIIRFRGQGGTFPTYSVSDIVSGKVPPHALANKIVLVGATGTGLEDLKPTPLDTDEPGVEVQATIIDNILRGDFLVRSMLGVQEVFFALALGFVTVIASTYLGALWAGMAEALLALIYISYAQYMLFWKHEVIGIFVPIFIAIVTYTVLGFYRYLTEGREKRYLRTVFEHYLHPEVINQLVEHPELLRLGGERYHLTIMFTDIVNFTSRAERTPPGALVSLLNTYTTAMTDLILESRGVVDKLMGDGIMAFWGTPVDVPNAAKAAIDCGLAMLSRLNELRREDSRFSDLYIGIGIHVGDAIAGNFGSARRFDYTIIGDDVNFASRLEGLTRQFKVPLLVSAETLREAGSDEYLCREIGMVKVKGKADLISIVEVVGTKTDLEKDGLFYRSFADAMTLARAGSWQAASASLSRLLEQRPTDEVTRLCLEKIRLNQGLSRGQLMFEFDTK
jgi:adenylate cyclase